MEEVGMNFYQNKRVLVTGSTGFKGTWLCRMLVLAGAQVTGFALTPPTEPSLFVLTDTANVIRQVYGDVRDRELLLSVMTKTRPEIVFHLAAQPLVCKGYADPVYTYSTNVMGTVNLLDCVRLTDSVRSVVNITTDKVYRSSEWEWGYRETDPLDGYDPYANSKSCSELVTRAYSRCFLTEQGTAVSTCRAGNVIGGGDFSENRIIPDCIRAVQSVKPILLRNPDSVRPYQHVLEPLTAYLLLAQKQYETPALAGCYNIGPEERDCLRTGELAALFCKLWGNGAAWESRAGCHAMHEANLLKLDCSRIRQAIGWTPLWNIETALHHTVDWTKAWMQGDNIAAVTDEQIKLRTGDGFCRCSAPAPPANVLHTRIYD